MEISLYKHLLKSMLFPSIILQKMKTTIENGLVQYYLPTQANIPHIHLNKYIGRSFRLVFENEIYCIKCKRKIKKTFGQGFCYPCFSQAPENSECIIRPELCQAHLGKGRDMDWEKKYHLQTHIIYLALSSATKVGVTQKKQIPTRWIDQGASKAIILAQMPNRYLAGVGEVALKSILSDKTHWQKMLKNDISTNIDLQNEKVRAKQVLPKDLHPYYSENNQIYELHYPVLDYPKKIKSSNLDKEHSLEGRLVGIKGQYLLFDEGKVINIRKYTGYKVRINT